MKNRLNPELGHLLYIMNSYPQLRDTVEDIIDEVTKQPIKRLLSTSIVEVLSDWGSLRTLKISKGVVNLTNAHFLH